MVFLHSYEVVYHVISIIMKKFIFSTLIAVLFFVLGATEIFACSCKKPREVEEEHKTAVAVFSGEVISVAQSAGSTKVKIRVEKTWKGSLTKTIEIRGGGMCGYNFTAGKKYLIYASGTTENGLSASLCSRTKNLPDAAEDVKLLDELKR